MIVVDRRMRTSGARLRAPAIVLALLSWFAVPVGAAHLGAAPPDTTRVVVLGVDHSTQLVSEAQQPAALRAFFDRVAPDGIAVERPPEEFSRGDHYEFTYEIQYIAVPYARERRIPLHPIDWIPPKEDMLLGWGVDLEALPFVRRGWQGFVSFPDGAVLEQPLFFADTEEDRAKRREQFGTPWEPASRDLARRMFWYRTYMQARRVALAAAEHRGGTLLVVVGANHKDDIERILSSDPRIEIVQPSSYGVPTAEEVAAATRTKDLYAIATFNVLGVQARTGVVAWEWVDRVLDALARAEPGETPELRLLRTRAAVLRGGLEPAAALREYAAIRDAAPEAARFTWDGVKDRSRVDSYFDPFGNLTVRQRAALEMAREHYRLGDVAAGDAIRDELAGALGATARMQFMAYWPEYVGEGTRS